MSSKSPAEPVLQIAGRDVAIAVVRSALARRMSLRIDRRGDGVRLTLPVRAALKPALAWVETKRSWVEAQLAAMPENTVIEPGSLIPFGDQSLMLDWDEARPRRLRIDGDSLIAGGPLDTLGPRVLRWLKGEAKRVLTAETLAIANKAGVSITSVGIGDPVSRWGSCAASGMIRYSWRLIMAPVFVRQATVAHEVAHRVHMNHSRDFHALVRVLHGKDPTPARAWLRANGAGLHRFG